MKKIILSLCLITSLIYANSLDLDTKQFNEYMEKKYDVKTPEEFASALSYVFNKNIERDATDYVKTGFIKNLKNIIFSQNFISEKMLKIKDNIDFSKMSSIERENFDKTFLAMLKDEYKKLLCEDFKIKEALKYGVVFEYKFIYDESQRFIGDFFIEYKNCSN